MQKVRSKKHLVFTLVFWSLNCGFALELLVQARVYFCFLFVCSYIDSCIRRFKEAFQNVRVHIMWCYSFERMTENMQLLLAR